MDGVPSGPSGGGPGYGASDTTATRSKTPNSPSKSSAAKNKRRKEKRAQAASESTLEPASGLELSKPTGSEVQPTPPVKRVPPRKVVLRPTLPPPPPPPPQPPFAAAQLVAAHVNKICLLAVHTIADVLRGVLSVFGFAFVVLQKPM